MPRPDDRPLRRLPQLEPRRATLERCVFCPKLCRSACPVSDADTRETVTPWGKMSMTCFAANESVELAAPFAAPAWACTGCLACRESCDHANDVAGTLFAARSAFVSAGVAPEAATKVLASFGRTEEALRQHAKEISSLPEVDPRADTAVLVGCAYAKGAPDVARDAVRAIAKLSGAKVALVDVCCGAPLLHAGDEARLRRQSEALGHALRDKTRLVVVDAGCTSTIRVHHAAAGHATTAEVVHHSELAARELGSLGPVSGLFGEGPVRYHDPCQLGRGLGVYDQPRAVLARALGRAPDEFARSRERARCSGGGGLLPVTMPDVSTEIARQRLEDHERSGGGTVVTACASSAKRLGKNGARVIDLVTVVARALGIAEHR